MLNRQCFLLWINRLILLFLFVAGETMAAAALLAGWPPIGGLVFAVFGLTAAFFLISDF